MLLCEEKSGWLKGVVALVNHDEIASDVKNSAEAAPYDSWVICDGLWFKWTSSIRMYLFNCEITWHPHWFFVYFVWSESL